MKNIVTKIVKKHLKNEVKVSKIMSTYSYTTYNLNIETNRFIRNDIKKAFNFYKIYYLDNFNSNIENNLKILNGLMACQKRDLLSFTYGMSFKKDNVINMNKNSTDLFEFLHFYKKDNEELNQNLLQSTFKSIKIYLNGKEDYKVSIDLYNYLKLIHYEEMRDDTKIIDFAKSLIILTIIYHVKLWI